MQSAHAPHDEEAHKQPNAAPVGAGLDAVATTPSQLEKNGAPDDVIWVEFGQDGA